MEIPFKVEPFRLPNFVRVGGTSIDVADLTDEQAEAYWADMRREWRAHVKHRREHRALIDKAASAHGRLA